MGMLFRILANGSMSHLGHSLSLLRQNKRGRAAYSDGIPTKEHDHD